MRTVVYVDGFNLYYGALRGTPFKWLDLYALFRDHVRDHAALTLGLVAPLRDVRQLSADLRKLTHWQKLLSSAHLASAQLPARIPGTSLTRPAAWNEGTGGALRQPE